MGNLINDDLDLSSCDFESESEYDSRSECNDSEE